MPNRISARELETMDAPPSHIFICSELGISYRPVVRDGSGTHVWDDTGACHVHGTHCPRAGETSTTEGKHAMTATHADAETIRYTADVVLLTRDQRVLLIQRAHDPYAGGWALPGGHVDAGETSRRAAVRELEEETGIQVAPDALRELGVFDEPGRDPRGRYVSVAYVATLPGEILPTAGDDAKEARWWRLTDLPSLAFDHAAILNRVM